MSDPNNFFLKDYITLTLSISAFLATLYNILIISRRGFKLNTFNAVVTLNKEFNEHFKNFEDRSKKITETNRTIETKKVILEEKEEEMSNINPESDDYKKQNKEIKELNITIKHLNEDLEILISQRAMDTENCMNIIDILYFGVHRLNILSNDLRYNFFRISEEAIQKFEESGYDWIKADYENVYNLLNSWTKSDKKEKEIINSSISDNVVHFYQGFEEITNSIYFIIKKVLTNYGLRLTFLIFNASLSILGVILLFIIFFQIFISEG